MKASAGLLLFRRRNGATEVFLVHPGGPFWKNKDEGAWSIPKGEYHDQEDPLLAARREFREETGMEITGEFIALSTIKQKGGKLVSAWAIEKDLDPASISSNTFLMEWPPRSGRKIEVPEIDRAEWFSLAEAAIKINPAQVGFLEELRKELGIGN